MSFARLSLLTTVCLSLVSPRTGEAVQEAAPRVEFESRAVVTVDHAVCGVAIVGDATVICQPGSLLALEPGRSARVLDLDTATLRGVAFVRSRSGRVEWLSKRGPTLFRLNSNGEVERVAVYASLPPMLAGLEYVSSFQDGRIVVLRRNYGRNIAEFFRQERELTDTAEVLVVSPDSVVSIAESASAGEFNVRIGRASAILASPLARRRFIVAGLDRVALAYSDRYEISVLTPDGRSIGTVRLPDRNIPVSAAARRRVLEEFVGRGPDMARSHRARLAAGSSVESEWSEIDAMVFDQENRLWIRQPGPDSCEWHVYSPALARLFDVSLDCVLVVEDARADVMVASDHDRVVIGLLNSGREPAASEKPRPGWHDDTRNRIVAEHCQT